MFKKIISGKNSNFQKIGGTSIRFKPEMHERRHQRDFRIRRRIHFRFHERRRIGDHPGFERRPDGVDENCSWSVRVDRASNPSFRVQEDHEGRVWRFCCKFGRREVLHRQQIQVNIISNSQEQNQKIDKNDCFIIFPYFKNVKGYEENYG